MVNFGYGKSWLYLAGLVFTDWLHTTKLVWTHHIPILYLTLHVTLYYTLYCTL